MVTGSKRCEVRWKKGRTGEAESEKVNKCAERWAEYKVGGRYPRCNRARSTRCSPLRGRGAGKPCRACAWRLRSRSIFFTSVHQASIVRLSSSCARSPSPRRLSESFLSAVADVADLAQSDKRERQVLLVEPRQWLVVLLLMELVALVRRVDVRRERWQLRQPRLQLLQLLFQLAQVAQLAQLAQLALLCSACV